MNIKEFDVVVAGGGTGGVIAAVAAARTGAKTALIELKGYLGGTVIEGGTALHSFYNLSAPFPGVEKRQIVKGIAQELVDRLIEVGGCTGHAKMIMGDDYDEVNTSIDTELYKLVAFNMVEEAGVNLYLNSMITDAITEGNEVTSLIVHNRSGKHEFKGKVFIDATGYGDVSAYAGANFTEPNDYDVVNSMGVGGVSMEGFHKFAVDNNVLVEYALGTRSGEENKIVRVKMDRNKMPEPIKKEMSKLNIGYVTTTVHDDYFMFIKLNYRLKNGATDSDEVTKAEIELRKREYEAIKFIRKYIPGCEKAFIARTSPALNIRRARCIACDYDITLEDILKCKRFDDEVFIYGFHDNAPKIQIENGGWYGFSYRAMCVKGINNLFATGMMVTSSWQAHMSTRNTVSCMAQGQAAGTAAALLAKDNEINIRKINYARLRKQLEKDGVCF
jgi:hypothetical protein